MPDLNLPAWPVFAGIDWGGENHQLCVVAPDGKRLLETRVSHDVAGLHQLDLHLNGFGRQVPIAIERSEGLLVEHLLDIHALVDDAGHRLAVHEVAHVLLGEAEALQVVVLDVAGVATLIVSAVLVVLLLTHHASGPTREDDWLTAAVVAICGATCGLCLFAMSRLVTYVKACAVLLAKSSADVE